MELTKEHYSMAKVAYDGYCKQTGWKSLVSGADLPHFDALKPEIKDAWAAAYIAIANELHRQGHRPPTPAT